MLTAPTLNSSKTSLHATTSALYFPALTGVRVIAAWLVFFHHFSPFPVGSLGWRITSELHIGVAIFFVLSGLLICLRYVDRLEVSTSWVKRYVRNRVARIYPMYFLITCLTFLVIQYYPAYDVMDTWSHFPAISAKLGVIVLNLTFLRGLFEGFRFTGVAPGWTLTVEEMFYFTAPFMLWGLRSKPGRLLFYAAGLLLAGVLLVQFAPHPYGFFGSFPFLFEGTFFGRCLEFVVGMGLALFLLKKMSAPGHGFYTWGGIGWIVAVVALLVWVRGPALASQHTVWLHIALNNVGLVPGICALLYGLIREETVLRRLLATKAFDLLGKASYTFYLIHMGILSRFLDFNVTQNLFLKFVLTNLVAIALLKLVEEPMHKWLTKRS